MEITINYYGQAVSVEVYEYLTQADHKAENLAYEQRRHWVGRECDEYIISTEGRLPYCATPEELVCQCETLDEILAVLALCTPTQRERFLPYRQWQMPADETRPVLCRALGADEIEEHRLSALWRQTTRQSTLAEFAQ